MDKIFMVYKTDVHHSYASRDLIGVTTERGYAMLLCMEKAKKEGHEISGNQEWNLGNLEQTQGYSGEGEFHYESVELNQLL